MSKEILKYEHTPYHREIMELLNAGKSGKFLWQDTTTNIRNI